MPRGHIKVYLLDLSPDYQDVKSREIVRLIGLPRGGHLHRTANSLYYDGLDDHPFEPVELRRLVDGVTKALAPLPAPLLIVRYLESGDSPGRAFGEIVRNADGNIMSYDERGMRPLESFQRSFG